jgi:hypothetical protein
LTGRAAGWVAAGVESAGLAEAGQLEPEGTLHLELRSVTHASSFVRPKRDLIADLNPGQRFAKRQLAPKFLASLNSDYFSPISLATALLWIAVDGWHCRFQRASANSSKQNSQSQRGLWAWLFLSSPQL